MKARLFVTCALLLAIQLHPQSAVSPAQAFRARGEPVIPNPDGAIVCEAEEFRSERPGWQAKAWGENYYAATFANSFLSRKAFLGAAEQADTATARITVRVDEPGRYLVLARYEAAYRFETRFRIQVEQRGRTLQDRVYGARDNLKIWAFGKKLQKEVAWDWGAVENIVWEGHDAFVDLERGEASVRLIAGSQPTPAARRNVDLVMLTRDAAGVRRRIDGEGYLPLDGLLTQAGDVWLKVANPGSARLTARSLAFWAGPWQEHSPYWVHQREWKPLTIDVAPGAETEWIEVGTTMDTLNDGQWGFECTGRCSLTFGLKDAAGAIGTLRRFEVSGKLPLVGQADSRYSRALPKPEEMKAALLRELAAVTLPGRLPTLTPLYATTAIPELYPLFGLTSIDGNARGPHGYVDWRGKSAAQLEELLRPLDDARKKEISVVSLGDEIALPQPDSRTASAGFRAFLEQQGVTAADVDSASGGDPQKLAYDPSDALRTSKPGVFYWSRRYLHQYGIARMKELTDVLARQLPNAGIGANFSPHGNAGNAYLGAVFQWVSCFRQSCLTLPWSEDYAWQVPVASPQLNEISLDLFRAGVRGKDRARLLHYVMPHSPGNTPRMWRRQFHAALGHAMKAVDLFEFNPVWAAYTENHVSDPAMYATVLRTFKELGTYEDLVQAGRVRAAETGLFFSETSDIWGDNDGSFGAAKRSLYLAIRHAQAPLDVVVEEDTLDGYRVLFLTDRHVSRKAARRLADWVRAGGTLFATAGAGTRDEYDQPNAAFRGLLPVDGVTIEAPSSSEVRYEKQDLPFATPIDTVASALGSFPVFGAVARFPKIDLGVVGRFRDGSTAFSDRAIGRGRVIACAFQPGLSVLKPAIPLRPLDRGATDAAMSHLMPTGFDPAARALVALAVSSLKHPVELDADHVEATLIESAAGLLVPLINWTGSAKRGLTVTLRVPTRGRATLAGGGVVTEVRSGPERVLRLDTLDVADVLVLR